jgi:transmembrane sensor
MLKQEAIIQILWRYKQKEKLSNSDRRKLRAWLLKSEKNQELFDDLSNPEKWNKELEEFKGADPNIAWLNIRERIGAEELPVKRIHSIWINIAAASIILLLITGLGYWFIYKNFRRGSEINKDNYVNQGVIVPGKNTASLTLSDGSLVNLDTASQEYLSVHEGIQITKKDSGTISYENSGSVNFSAGQNTLNVPKGGQYHLQLPDGTEVWLNASSSLKFPTAFSRDERRLILSGEAYFEIAKDKSKPFIVETEKGFVRVLGTHFNLNAYPDEMVISVTLLEGSVEMGKTDYDSIHIHPGEFASINENGKMFHGTANIDQVMAWRRNTFWFRNATYEEIMKQLERWYDVKISFKNHSGQRFSGILPRDRPLGELLTIMEKEGHVHFELDGRRLLISPS